MTEALDVDLVVRYNEVLCGDTGEPSALLDRPGLEAALARPFSGFGDHEAFGTVYEKAAALLHGIAARQVFENGNKRTAWAVAVAFLDFNDVDLGSTETVQSDMFVRAVALDHTLSIVDIAEWFEVAHLAARNRQEQDFVAFDGQRLDTPMGVLRNGLPTGLVDANILMVRGSGVMVEVFAVAPTVAPENVGRPVEERDVHVVAGFRMPGQAFLDQIKLYLNVLSTPESRPTTVGRNDLCPCGSGKKFKRCHGAPAAS